MSSTNYLSCVIIGVLLTIQSALGAPVASDTARNYDEFISDEFINDEFTNQQWVSDNGEPASLSSLPADILVTSLFYSNCPNTCNLTIERYKKLDARFKQLGVSAKFVLITLDPETDTPKVLNRYREQRGLKSPDWHFLSGSEQQVEYTARHLGYSFTRLDDHVFHRMKIFLLNKAGNIVETITMKTDIDKLTVPSEESQNG